MKKKPTIRTTGECALSREEYQKLIAHAENFQDRLMLMIGVGLGLRRSDLARVRLENIDFDKHELKYLEKKKKDRARTVPIPPKLETELKLYRVEQKRTSGPIFTCSDRQLWNRFAALCDRAGVARRPVHALRSTCVSFLMNADFSVAEAAKILGDTESTVFQHYISQTSSYLNDKMRKVDI